MMFSLFIFSFLTALYAFNTCLPSDVDTVTETHYEELWNKFNKIYKKNFNTEEERQHSHNVFWKTIKKIESHNSEAQLGLHSFTLGINKFADNSPSEFYNKLSLNRNALKFGFQYLVSLPRYDNVSLEEYINVPEEFDWRKYKVVSSVKDQGECGSCWAFTIAGVLESHGAIVAKSLPTELSVQELVDCDFENYGCDGGMLHTALNYSINNKWLTPWTKYPYSGRKSTCKVKNRANAASSLTTTSYKMIKDDENVLKYVLWKHGPVAIGIHVSEDGNMPYYKSGVFQDEDCSPNKVNHAVLLVGYGIDKRSNLEYWLIKNSWGDSWGESGYLRLRRNRSNMCGVSSMAVLPFVKNE